MLRLISVVLLLAGAAYADEWNKRFSVSGKARLKVETGDGSIAVRPGSGSEIEARVETRGWTIGPSDVQIIDRQTGNLVEIEVRIPRMRWTTGRRWVHLELRVPPELEANLHTGDGSITAEGVKGDLRFSTGDGEIRADSIEGALDASTGDGAIRVNGRFDTLSLHTGDGSVEADVRQGSKIASSWRVKTGDGSVRLRLPESLSAELDAHTGDGRITCDLPVTVSGSIRKNDLRGRLNGGGALLSVRSGDGSIHLSRMP